MTRDTVCRYNVVSCASAQGSSSTSVDEPAVISVRTTSKEDFDGLLKLVRTSAAEPASFAIPVGATEDEQSYMMAFDVAQRDPRELAVEASEQRLVVWGFRRKMQNHERRTCILAKPINPESLAVEFAGKVIRVRVSKKPT